MTGKFMTIDNIPIELTGEEKNLLEVIRRTGIELPTFCYYSELSVYGACRMCMVEDDRGNIHAACSTPPKAGMTIYTNTSRLRKYRRNILELLLANHCRDCTTCEKSSDCKLQQLAQRFHITGVRFPNAQTKPDPDCSSPCISIDHSKCILCGDCVRMCNEVQHVGAIDFAYRGANMVVSPAFGRPMAESGCVGCGQCAAVCPTGAIVVKKDTERLWEDLADSNTRVIAQIAPAVRTGVSKTFNEKYGDLAMGKLVAALRRMGFDEVFDTSTSADLTVLEESSEFLERLETGGKLPLYTSCCPAWSMMAKTAFPDLAKNISMTMTPMVFTARMMKQADPEARMCFIGPCAAKKLEASRRTVRSDVDFVLTFEELAGIIEGKDLDIDLLEVDENEAALCSASAAGRGFAQSGGVANAVANKIKEWHPDMEVKIASAQGLADCKKLLMLAKAGKYNGYLLEGMGCPGGCIGGAGTIADPARTAIQLNKYMKEAPFTDPEQSPYMSEIHVLKDDPNFEL